MIAKLIVLKCRDFKNLFTFSKFIFLAAAFSVLVNTSYLCVFDWFRTNFRFLIDLQVLGRPEHDLNIYGKCLSIYVFVCIRLCVCDKNFVASIAQELMHKMS